ncbi:MAG: HPP family protein [Leptospirales bacterium]
MKKTSNTKIPVLTDEEIETSMKELGGFIDITSEDFRAIYEKAYKKALTHKGPEPEPERESRRKSNFIRLFRPISEPSPMVSLKEILWSWLGAFFGIAAVGYLHYDMLGPQGTVMVVGSFGATAVLIYGAIRSPLAQPRNVFGGHIVSAIAGVVSWQLFSQTPWFAAAFAVATAIAFMHVTRTLHPPGGATALIAVIGGAKIQSLGFAYVVSPIFTGIFIMMAVSLFFNNIVKWRKYPEYWL